MHACLCVKQSYTRFNIYAFFDKVFLTWFFSPKFLKSGFKARTVPNGYVQRVSRGIYRITEKGEKLLEILN